MGVVGRLDQYASMLCNEFDEYSMSENLLTYSEQFDNAAWSKASTTVSANATTAPDGTLTADLLTEDTSTSAHWIYYSTSPFTANTYTLSVFAKQAVGSRYLRFSGFGLDAISESPIFDVSSGIIYSPPTTTRFKTASIIPYPNGWYRCVCTIQYELATGQRPFFRLTNSTTNFGNYTYTGDGTSGIYLWGAQLEYGSVATDYTPTTGTAIRRVLPATTNTNITGLGTYYSSGFDENVGFATTLTANVFPPYDPVYDEFAGVLYGAGQGTYMRQNTDKSVIVYNEIDEVTTIY